MGFKLERSLMPRKINQGKWVLHVLLPKGKENWRWDFFPPTCLTLLHKYDVKNVWNLTVVFPISQTLKHWTLRLFKFCVNDAISSMFNHICSHLNIIVFAIMTSMNLWFAEDLNAFCSGKTNAQPLLLHSRMAVIKVVRKSISTAFVLTKGPVTLTLVRVMFSKHVIPFYKQLKTLQLQSRFQARINDPTHQSIFMIPGTCRMGGGEGRKKWDKKDKRPGCKI